ncbi:fatty acyl-CoA reductase [Trifolium repens]|nr:fatty acyl-CoA reductase [Trifolium repens]
MVAHANQPGDVVYHVGSSVRNPVTYLNLQDYGFNYFTENIIGNELIGPNGKGLDPLSIWKIQIVMRLVELYRPYLFFKGIFDDINTEKLQIAARQSGTEMNLFCFDPKEIDWEDYFINTHIPGLVKYIFK